jgi:FMN phosphatase YigB (HAD superfamily)
MPDETPETDEFWENSAGGSDGHWHARDFCRQMERERNSETRWAHHYKTECERLNARLASMVHIDELREKVRTINCKQEYWRDGPAALKALLDLFRHNVRCAPTGAIEVMLK